MFKLYDYFRSSACFRVRIALNLKAQTYEAITVHLAHEGGQHLHEHYRTLNPQMLVPTLEDTTTQTLLTQSSAIIEFLEESFPEPALLPKHPIERARVRAFSQAIACDMHPLNNLRVLKYLTSTFHISEEQKNNWYHHWLQLGFQALEKTLSIEPSKGPFCFGQTPTMADIFLIPQIYNALRFEYTMTSHPFLHNVYQHCLTLPAFSKALPDNQAPI